MTKQVPILTVQPGDVVFQHGYQWRVTDLFHGQEQVILTADAVADDTYHLPGGGYDHAMTLGFRPDMNVTMLVCAIPDCAACADGSHASIDPEMQS